MIDNSSNVETSLNVLLVEDNISLAEEMISFLSANKMIVSHASNIIQLNSLLTKNTYSLLILDRLLPDGDAIEHLSNIKSHHTGCIVILSALSMSHERIVGLNSGADYYLAKPVDLNELLAVIYAVNRKVNTSPALSSWLLLEEKNSLQTPNNVEISLTGTEFNLVATLMHQQNKVLKREDIVYTLGFEPSNYDVRSLDTIVCRLRAKIRKISGDKIPIHTFSKVGYAWKTDLITDNNT
jgi:DNA-binding response OmpR family regulator